MSQSITWVGLDVHKSSISVCVLDSSKGPMVEWRIEHTRAKVKKLARKLAKLADGAEIRVCYEAGPCGWTLKRLLEETTPLVCEVVAPSLIPTKAGDRVKTDRKDARKLAEYLRAGLLTEVAPPDETQESVRDLVRQRDAASTDLVRARHRLSKFLLRRHLSCDATNWSGKHMAWLGKLSFDDPLDQIVFRDLFDQVQQQTQRKEQLTDAVEEVATHAPYRDPVGWLRCFRGIDTITAMTILAEIFEFGRFGTAKKLMAYLGLTPSEHSSGDSEKRGGITKTGNTRVRRILVESAQHCKRPFRISRALSLRRANQPPEVVALADRAMRRLNQVYWRMTHKGKHHNVAVTACARELVGFIWALLHPAGVGAAASRN